MRFGPCKLYEPTTLLDISSAERSLEDTMNHVPLDTDAWLP
jgi:hypothetical protein